MQAAYENLSQLVAGLTGASVLVVGDVMIDEFVIGRVNRISPEAPVPVVEFDHREYRLGGAANVAHNIRALGGAISLVGVVGNDEAGRQLLGGLRQQGIETSGIVTDANRCTTRKLRIVTTRNQQVARVDYEEDIEVTTEISRALNDRVAHAAAGAQVVLVSDYLKGTITKDLMSSVIDGCRQRKVPLLVDPKIPHLDYYQGATLITPNHHEAEVATHMRLRTETDAAAVAHAFRERAGCEAVLITRGEAGMCLLDGSSPTGQPLHLSAAAREVSDVTGAGDTVIATLALALAAGATLADAARLANYAASVVVGKFGPATVAQEELLRALAAA